MEAGWQTNTNHSKVKRSESGRLAIMGSSLHDFCLEELQTCEDLSGSMLIKHPWRLLWRSRLCWCLQSSGVVNLSLGTLRVKFACSLSGFPPTAPKHARLDWRCSITLAERCVCRDASCGLIRKMQQRPILMSAALASPSDPYFRV